MDISEQTWPSAPDIFYIIESSNITATEMIVGPRSEVLPIAESDRDWNMEARVGRS